MIHADRAGDIENTPAGPDSALVSGSAAANFPAARARDPGAGLAAGLVYPPVAARASGGPPPADRAAILERIVNKQYECIVKQNHQLAALREKAQLTRVYWVVALCLLVEVVAVSFAFASCRRAQ